MVNKFYRMGRRAEYKKVAELKAQGFQYAGRTAGSHGIFDVYGIKLLTPGGPHRGIIKLVQIKTGKSAERERDKARASIEMLSGLYYVEGVVA